MLVNAIYVTWCAKHTLKSLRGTWGHPASSIMAKSNAFGFDVICNGVPF